MIDLVKRLRANIAPSHADCQEAADHIEQLEARILAAIEPAPVSVLQVNLRETFEAMVAMRNEINEYVPMPSLESDLLQGPENSVFCATVADAVINHIKELTKCQSSKEHAIGATTNGQHGSAANAPVAVDSSEPAPVSVREAARVLLEAVRIEPVHDTIVRSVRLTPFCDALRAIAEGKDDE